MGMENGSMRKQIHVWKHRVARKHNLCFFRGYLPDLQLSETAFWFATSHETRGARTAADEPQSNA